MDEANHYYGHSGILRRYVGVTTPRPLIGPLQHGWNPGTGFTPRDLPRPLRRVVPCFVWNSKNLAASKAAGYRRVWAIGAPFLYLERLMPPRPGGPTGGTIAYPFHGWERQSVVGSHDAYAQEILEREGQATVCLYWLEYKNRSVRIRYESRGHRVICHGHRGEDEFLKRQMDELRGHSRMVTNRVATALWYAAWLRLEVEVYGPRMTLRGEGTPNRVYGSQATRWPALFRGSVSHEEGRSLAAEELGAEWIREPEDLASMIGLRGPGRLTAAAAAIARRAWSRALKRV